MQEELFSSSLVILSPLLQGASHRHKDVQVEAVVGLPEEEDEDEAEETRAR